MNTEQRQFINSVLRSRVNRLAHELGVQHESNQRARLISELEGMAENGASLEDQHDYLDGITNGKDTTK